MKNAFLIIFTITFLFSCTEKKTDKNFELTGNIKGLDKGTLYIKRVVDTTLVVIDSISISGDSHFKSSFNLNSPEMLYLFLDRGVTNSIDDSILFFAEPGKINIDTELDFFYANAKITGSKNHKLYEDYKKINARFIEQQLALTELKFKAVKLNNNIAIDSIKKLEDANLKRRYLYAVNFAMSNKEYEVSPYVVLSDIPDVNLKYLDTIQKSMPTKIAKSLYGKKLITFYQERQKIE